MPRYVELAYFVLEGYWDVGFDQAEYLPRPELPAPEAVPRSALAVRQTPRKSNRWWTHSKSRKTDFYK